ncbi:NAGV14pili biogenesis VcfQ domain protein [Vibrio paracholerae]|nr:NAGV14pili biogenesis VcfQ domain protein [Vibrio paracholerae]
MLSVVKLIELIYKLIMDIFKLLLHKRRQCMGISLLLALISTLVIYPWSVISPPVA